jgi:hypothetical protein
MLALGGGLAALFVSRDAGNFAVVQAMFGIAAAVVIMIVLSFFNRD